MDGNHNNAMDDSAMMRYLLGKYGLTDLVGMLRSMSANGENSLQADRTRGCRHGAPNVSFV
jgi:hypothetical protein